MVSVVIPAFNEEKIITNCLNAMASQTTSRDFEVILVNNNSTDKTVEIAKTYAKRIDLKIIEETKKGRGPARKRGFEEAKGEIILSTDSDTVVPSDWLEKMVSQLEESKAVALSGTCKVTDCSPVMNMLFNFLQPQFMRVYRLFFGHFWLSGFNFAIYKDAYQKSGGFDVDLNAQEDVDLAKKVSIIGKIQFINDLPVIFSGRRFHGGLLKGLIPYFTTYAEYFFFKKKNVILTDVR